VLQHHVASREEREEEEGLKEKAVNEVGAERDLATPGEEKEEEQESIQSVTVDAASCCMKRRRRVREHVEGGRERCKRVGSVF
jgi:hypothetical protein